MTAQPPRSGTPRSRIAAAVFAGAALLVLTEQVLTHGPVTALDLDIAHWLQQNGPRHPRILQTAEVISRLANPQWSVAVSLILAAAMSRHTRSWQSLKRMTAAVVLLTATVLGLKALTDRPGPPGSGATGYFPSGHTTTAVVCAGMLTLLGRDLWPRRRFHLTALAAAWAVLVGGP